eukprot:169504-Hanusia_phi.AAC.3
MSRSAPEDHILDNKSSTCQSSNFTDGMWNLVITVVLYNYLAYIAWSFRVRLENGTAYGVAQREQSGEYIFGVSSELYRASSLIHHRPHVPMFVVYARPFEDYLHSKNEPALGVPVAEHRLVVPQRHEAVLGRAAWPAPVSSMESDSGSGMNSAAMEEGSNVDDDSSSLEDINVPSTSLHSLKILFSKNTALQPATRAAGGSGLHELRKCPPRGSWLSDGFKYRSDTFKASNLRPGKFQLSGLRTRPGACPASPGTR